MSSSMHAGPPAGTSEQRGGRYYVLCWYRVLSSFASELMPEDLLHSAGWWSLERVGGAGLDASISRYESRGEWLVMNVVNGVAVYVVGRTLLLLQQRTAKQETNK